jgi:protein phosphatase
MPASRGIPGGRIDLGAATHIGASPRRTLLEDRCLAVHVHTAAGLSLALGIVADGVGGERAGERAAELTQQAIVDACEASRLQDVPAILSAAIREANAHVYREGCRVRRRSGMSSTVAVAAIADGRLYLAAAGDSRVYLVRDGRAIQLTRDHTWGEEALRAGRLTPEAEARHPRRADLVRSIGLAPEIEPDPRLWLEPADPQRAEADGRLGLPLRPGDAVVVATDGLSKDLPASASQHFVERDDLPGLVRGRSAEEAARALVMKAVERGTDDNVSVVVMLQSGRRGVLAAVCRARSARAGGLATLVLLAGAWVGIRAWPGRAGEPSAGAPPAGMAAVVRAEGEPEIRIGAAPWTEAQPGRLLRAEEGIEIRTGAPPGHLRLELADGTQVDVGPEAAVSFLGWEEGRSSTKWSLRRGVLLVFIPDGLGATVDVLGPRSILSRALGALMGVWLDPGDDALHTDCLRSRCAVVGPPPDQVSLLLGAGEHAAIGADGVPRGPDPVGCGVYAYAPDWVVCPTAMPTPAGTLLRAPTATPLGALFVPPTATPHVEAPEAAPGRRAAPPTATDEPPPTSAPTEPPPATDPPEPPPPEPPPEEPPEEPPEPPPPPDDPPPGPG